MTEDHDGELAQRLAGLAEASGRTARLSNPEMVRRTARRRAVTAVAASVVAVTSVVAGGWAVLGQTADDRGLPPATPPPISATPSTTPTQTLTPPSEGPWITTIPAGFRLPSEGADRWRPNRDHNELWLLLPCLDIHGIELFMPYRSDAARTDWRSIFTRDVEYFAFEQLGLYPDAATADAALQEMRNALRRCATQSRDFEGNAQHRHRESFWATKPVELSGGPQPDNAFHAYNWNRWYDDQGDLSYRLGGPFITVLRVGNAILLVGHDGETDWAAPGAADRAAEQAAAELEAYLPELCVFAADGTCGR